MIILPTTRGILKSQSAAVGGGQILWTTNNLNTATISSPTPNATFTVSSGTGDGEGVFTNALPATGQYYFDCTLDDGHTSGVGFFGFSNTTAAFQYAAQANYKAWYWSGAWWGNAATISNGDSSALLAGTYRIAVDRTNNRFYMRRTGPTASTVRSANLPATTGANVYLMMMGQAGYKAVGVSIANGGALNSGSGGLY